MKDDKLITPKEAAVLLGSTEKTLANKRAVGLGCKFIKLGDARKSSIRYKISDIQEYIGSFESGLKQPKQPLDGN